LYLIAITEFHFSENFLNVFILHNKFFLSTLILLWLDSPGVEVVDTGQNVLQLWRV